MKMAKPILFILLLVSGNTFSQKDSSLSKQIDTIMKTNNIISIGLNKIDSSLKRQEDSAQNNFTLQLSSDISALDNARKNPLIFLYKNYIFCNCPKIAASEKEPCCPPPTQSLKITNIVLAFLVLVIIWGIAFKFAKNGALLKDESFEANGNRVVAANCPFSFARAQLFWWTMIVLSCYVIFFGLTGVLPPLNATAIGLLGLSVFVYGAGKVIDNRQMQVNKGSRSQDADANQAKPNFLEDILSDDNGISIHRFQALIFNIAFGVVFIAIFIEGIGNRKYPFADFTDIQFTLMGISSATYLGLKTAENNPSNAKKDVTTGKGAVENSALNEVPAAKDISKF